MNIVDKNSGIEFIKVNTVSRTLFLGIIYKFDLVHFGLDSF